MEKKCRLLTFLLAAVMVLGICIAPMRVSAAGTVHVTKEDIPDEALWKAIICAAGGNMDNLSEYDEKGYDLDTSVKTLCLELDYRTHLESLKGLELFPDLEVLEILINSGHDARKNIYQHTVENETILNSLANLKSLWINLCVNGTSWKVKNPKLEKLRIDGGTLKSLDVSACTKLKDIFFRGVKFTKLNLAKNKELAYIYLYAPELNNLTLPDSTTLESLHINSKCLTKLKLSKYKKLERLFVDYCTKLKELDVSGCAKLDWLDALDCTELKKLDVSGCTKLKNLYVSGSTKLKELDVSDCTKLESFAVDDCTKLKNLDVSNCKHLTYLNCKGTKLSKLNLKSCKKLEYISIDAYTTKSLALPSNLKQKTEKNYLEIRLRVKKNQTIKLKNYIPSGFQFAGYGKQRTDSDKKPKLAKKNPFPKVVSYNKAKNEVKVLNNKGSYLSSFCFKKGKLEVWI
ncbi:MAG: hypothetical protein K2G89_03500, partial [Lachnospiraceae bacterium]|nr:hypothetical protein [Lachnospiraceae bacterium]